MGCCEARPDPNGKDPNKPDPASQERFIHLLSQSFIEVEDDEDQIFSCRRSQGPQPSRHLPNSNIDCSDNLRFHGSPQQTSQRDTMNQALTVSQLEDRASLNKMRNTQPYTKDKIDQLKPTTYVTLSTNICQLNANQGYIEIVERRIKKRELIKVQKTKELQRNTIGQRESGEALESVEHYQLRKSVGQRILSNFFPHQSGNDGGVKLDEDDNGYPIMYFNKEPEKKKEEPAPLKQKYGMKKSQTNLQKKVSKGLR